ncbi:short-chain dehydrogenase [Clostridium novyi A str. 4570]|uniref:Short-chain dehydrogenase n=1 Tax=Clostridium novyi A str. 4570 TaxID=1444290 RepID=A0AA88ZMC5_CLONO|nr:SDR family oxidoreductase [Clostridium novyi]KGN00635.1 short-chain dehydrogenase [Clostridium novyi A str. 4570]
MIKNNLQNKNVLITGASSGIGYELSKIFACNGYNLILIARNYKVLEEMKKEIIDKFNVKVKIIKKDLSIVSSALEIFNELKKENIDVDILVNNAGAGYVGLFNDIDYKKDIDIINLNITTLTVLTKLFSSDMIKRGCGRILNVASTGAYQPGPYTAVYYATKAYVLSLSEALRIELKNYGISVSTLCPGSTKTQFSKRAGKDDINVAMSAKRVAEIAYKGLLKNKRIIVPGFNNKLAILLSKISPGSVSGYFVKKIQKTLLIKKSPK